MPKFNGQNKKSLDPRYFLNESLEREDIIDDIREFSKDAAGSRDTYGSMEKLAVMDLEELNAYFATLIKSEKETFTSTGYDKKTGAYGPRGSEAYSTSSARDKITKGQRTLEE